MPMAPYTHLDFGSRLAALRAVGTALSLAPTAIPDQSANNSGPAYVYYLNQMRVAKALPPLTSLDYTGFVPALNVLAALVP